MKDFMRLQLDLKNNPELKKLGMEIAQYIFSKSQENLSQPMPWGDNSRKSFKKPTTISDKGLLLLSGTPPFWIDNNTIELGYDAPHAVWVEYGTAPHPVAASKLQEWVIRKLGKKKKESLSVAFAIANTIKKQGMDPHPFLRPAIESAKSRYNLRQI